MHYSMINQFLLIWVKWNRPCDLDIRRSRREAETIGVVLTVEGEATEDMLRDVVASLRLTMVEMT